MKVNESLIIGVDLSDDKDVGVLSLGDKRMVRSQSSTLFRAKKLLIFTGS